MTTEQQSGEAQPESNAVGALTQAEARLQQDLDQAARTGPARHIDGPRLDHDGYVVGEIELPGGLPPEHLETEDRERE